MLFNSFQFLIFFVIVYGFYLVLPHMWQNYLLIVSSCVFYSFWSWKFLLLMFASISTDFYCSNKIFQSNNKQARKKFLFLSIFVNLCILCIFKYFNFFIDGFQELFSLVFPSAAVHSKLAFKIILPIGISFYTFEAISYTVDVYKGILKPAKRYWDYVLFVIYFPHLVAGPIMRAKDFLPQITQPRRLTLEQFYEGCYLIFWGLFEKVFIADNLAKIVDPVFSLSPPYNGGTVLIAMYAFAFQIFCDFDGYSNIARGLGKCMGFDITINFKWPYFSANPREFWQRWHISLSSWFRDYVYIPMGGSKQGEVKTYRNLMVTMLLCGLWHGASWTFVVWGIYHGLLSAAYRFMASFKGELPLIKNQALKKFLFLSKIVIFFHLTCIGWLIFRAQSIAQMSDMFVSLFTQFTITTTMFDGLVKFSAIIVPLLLVQIGQYIKKDILFVQHQRLFVKSMICSVMFYLILGWGVTTAEEFIYFQF